MARRRRIYEGKEKTLYNGPEPGTIVLSSKTTSLRRTAKKGHDYGQSVLNNRITEFIMTRLHDIGVPTHFVRRLNMREQIVREVEIIPLELTVRTMPPRAASPNALLFSPARKCPDRLSNMPTNHPNSASRW